ncbi:hypothetical protein Nepgr_033997 [Nepenthes gracilis]|uniref:Uncharacterized protein n=1 Tax=Nepenthes gracilis TaxID=150966 RepID=A0AAD3TN81_NEPGR|nr:hypothetical protein Nepgr_033997 [Nepenthes gracilis]
MAQSVVCFSTAIVTPKDAQVAPKTASVKALKTPSVAPKTAEAALKIKEQPRPTSARVAPKDAECRLAPRVSPQDVQSVTPRLLVSCLAFASVALKTPKITLTTASCRPEDWASVATLSASVALKTPGRPPEHA